LKFVPVQAVSITQHFLDSPTLAMAIEISYVHSLLSGRREVALSNCQVMGVKKGMYIMERTSETSGTESKSGQGNTTPGGSCALFSIIGLVLAVSVLVFAALAS